jgi:DNA replication protein DnaC
MKLTGMAQALSEQLELPSAQELGFEERLGLLIDVEMTHRDNMRYTRRLKNAKLRLKASLEDVDYQHPRKLDRSLMNSLATCKWIKDHRNVLITGPTGVGKTYIACALAHQACRMGLTAYYTPISRLLQELVIMKGDGRYLQMLAKLARFDLLVLDDWGLDNPNAQQRRILLELLDDRYERKSTLIMSQFHPNLWHENLNDPTLADAILDRLIHNAYRLVLKGESLRKAKNSLTQPTLGKA